MKQEKSEILYKFFETQWDYPVKDDWTLEAKENLVEFGLYVNLDQIRTMSTEYLKI